MEPCWYCSRVLPANLMICAIIEIKPPDRSFVEGLENSYMNLFRIFLLSNPFSNFRIYFCAFSNTAWCRFTTLSIAECGRRREGLYCKRRIQCLASSEILTPHPLTARRVCTPAFGAGGGHTRWVERGWGPIIRKTPDTAQYSIYVSTLWRGVSFPSKGTRPMCCLIQYQSVDFKILRGKILKSLF